MIHCQSHRSTVSVFHTEHHALYLNVFHIRNYTVLLSTDINLRIINIHHFKIISTRRARYVSNLQAQQVMLVEDIDVIYIWTNLSNIIAAWKL